MIITTGNKLLHHIQAFDSDGNYITSLSWFNTDTLEFAQVDADDDNGKPPVAFGFCFVATPETFREMFDAVPLGLRIFIPSHFVSVAERQRTGLPYLSMAALNVSVGQWILDYIAKFRAEMLT